MRDAGNLPENERTAAVESYTRALEALRAGDAAAQRAAELRNFRDTLAQRLQEVQRALAEPLPPVEAKPAANATVADLERAVAGAEEAVKVAQQALQAAEGRIKERAQRQPVLPRLITAARERLTVAEAQLAAFKQPSPATAASEARLIELQAVRLAAVREIEALEAELRSYEGSEEFFIASRDLAQRDAARAEELLRRWQDLLQARRRQEAERAAADAARATAVAEAQNRAPILVAMAQENERLAKRRAEIADRLAASSKALQFAEQKKGEVERDLQDLRALEDRVEAARFSSVLGALLRDRRATVPDMAKVRKRLADLRAQRDALQLERFGLEDMRRRLRSPDALEQVLSTTAPEVAVDDLETVREVARLLDARAETVESLLKDIGHLLGALSRVELAELELIGSIESFDRFIDEHVLWAPSSLPIWRTLWVGERGGALWLLSPGNWAGVGSALSEDLVERPVSLLLAIVAVALLFRWRRRAVRRIAELGEVAMRGACVQLRPTLEAVLWTLLASAPLPAALLALGFRLSASAGSVEFVRAVASGLSAGAWLLFALACCRQLVREGGLAEKHFAWPATVIQPLRRGLAWITPIVVAGTIVLVMLERSGSESWKDGFGRLVLVAMLLALTLFFWRVFHPRTGIGSVTRRGAPAEGWAARTRQLWFLLGVGIPLALLGLDLAGYHFTATTLAVRFGASVGVVAGLFLLNELVVRALVLERRRLAFRLAAERRKASGGKDSEVATASITGVEEPLIDEAAIAEQTRRLQHSLLTLGVVLGMWIVWVDVLPALRVFQDVAIASEVSLADALLAAIVFVMTFLLARNIPGLLHLTVLQRLPMHDGERHAVATIARYLILLAGIIYGFSTLGLGWNKVQWLAAGVSVGLGFGLQEVFANFVSGLIILFERPVRVGDLVTVSGIDGYVTRIQMRATTIRDYNRKELIIPNKEFITGSVINWTLSDPVTRLVVKVGIAYGSDTALARRLLLQVAADEPHVLDKPRPKALFRAFGESSLDFELRAFTEGTDYWHEIIDSLHHRIDRAFREVGIEIAFPQRDLHLRSAEPLEKLLRDRPQHDDAQSNG